MSGGRLQAVHLQAARDARRLAHRVPTPPGNPSADPRRDFATALVAVLATATGMPPVATRVFTGLVTSSTGTTTAADLVRSLRLNFSSVSKAIGYLEDMGLVERFIEPADHREHFRVSDGIWALGIRAGSLGAVIEQLGGNDLTDPSTADAKSVLAALSRARPAVPAPQLADVLGWPAERLAAAIGQLRQRPILADPFRLHESEAGLSIQTRFDRLSAEQRAALDAPRL